MHYQGWDQLGWRWISLAAAACLPVLLACGSAGRVRHGPEAIFKTQPEAGTVHVGLQSVAPFEEYLDQLQPTFTLTAEQARICPIMRSFVTRPSRLQLGGGLTLSPPQTVTTPADHASS